MVERINLLLKAKNITARQFAEAIGIQPSGMSHILSGRNNPSLDFVMKVVKRWPEININWLMFGKGEMFVGLPNGVPDYGRSTEAESAQEATSTSGLASLPKSDAPLEEQAEAPLLQEYDLFSQPAVEPAYGEPKRQADAIGQQSSFQQQPQTGDPQTVASQAAFDLSSDPKPEAATVVGGGGLGIVGAAALVGRGETGQSAAEAPRYSKPNEIGLNGHGRQAMLPQPILAKKKITKVIILYEDHSFAEYSPE